MGKKSTKIEEIEEIDEINEDELDELNDEKNNDPNILLEESDKPIGDKIYGFGIAGKPKCYSLVVKKLITKSLEEEKLRYEWKPAPCYVDTLSACVDNWIDIRNRSKIRNKVKAELSEIKEILNDTKDEVRKAMGNLTIADNYKQEAIQMDNYYNIIANSNKFEELFKKADKLNELIDEKSRIIIRRTEPTKHRTKKEEE